MKTALLYFPGSNRHQDMVDAVTSTTSHSPEIIWHTQTELPEETDFIVVPGGFTYGDYLRCGAIAARSPIMRAVQQAADKGVPIFGVCNGFQILIEAGLLPGALMRNKDLHFVCREVALEVSNAQTVFTSTYDEGQIIRCPVAHGEGNYTASDEELKYLEGEGRIVFRYAKDTEFSKKNNVNGSVNDIAGIMNAKGNVLGMMPHPENYVMAHQVCQDGKAIFESVMASLNV